MRDEPARTIEAVLFDVGAVLIGPSAAAVQDIFRETAHTFVRSGHAARAFALADRDADRAGLVLTDVRSWARHWSQALRVDESVGWAVHQRILEDPALTSRVWSEVNPDAADAMSRLREVKVPVGLVSQSDGHVDVRLARAGLAHLVDVVVDSGRVPWDKPNPAIYRHAATLIGVPLSRCAFLGDVLTDVRGAVRAGCAHAFLYDPHEVCPDSEVPRATSLNAFVDVVLGGVPGRLPGRRGNLLAG